MVDTFIIINHDSCNFFIDQENGFSGKCHFIDEDQFEEDELCEKEGTKVVATEAFQENFRDLLQEWAKTERRFLVMDYTTAAVGLLAEMLKRKALTGADVFCVTFFHSDEDTIKPVDPGCEKNALGWKNWYLEYFSRFPDINIVEIPYGFTLTEAFLEALFDRTFPHADKARYRRVWKGNAQRRIDAELAKHDPPEWLVKNLQEQAQKRAAKKDQGEKP